MELIYTTIVGQLTVVGMLFRWLQVQTRDNRTRIDKAARESYTKDETKEAIDLRQAPLTIGINNVKEDIAEVKVMLIKLLDEKK